MPLNLFPIRLTFIWTIILCGQCVSKDFSRWNEWIGLRWSVVDSSFHQYQQCQTSYSKSRAVKFTAQTLLEGANALSAMPTKPAAPTVPAFPTVSLESLEQINNLPNLFPDVLTTVHLFKKISILADENFFWIIIDFCGDIDESLTKCERNFLCVSF